MRDRLELTGQKFGRLTAIKNTNKHAKGGQFIWLCRCDCGNTIEVRPANLKSGNTKSCGCILREQKGEDHPRYRHGDAIGSHNPHLPRIYRTWASMKIRCYNSNSKAYRWYGNKGITVCLDWLNKERGYANFRDWALNHGYGENLTIDRINHTGNYEPENCQWITLVENSKKAQRERREMRIAPSLAR